MFGRNSTSYLAKYAQEELNRGRIDRRTFLSLSIAGGAAATALALGGKGAVAAENEIVFANWGGESDRIYKEIFADTFTKTTGVGLSTDTSGPYRSKIEKMVKEDAVTWDTTDGDQFDAIALAKQGFLQQIDWSVVNRADIYPELFMDQAMAAYFYSFVIVYDVGAFGGQVPKSYADFWNLKDFPGQRAIWKYMCTLEPALLADGVAPEKLYPLDLSRAERKLKEIKSSTIFYDSFAQGQQALLDGEVTMVVLPNARGKDLLRSTNGEKAFTYSQGQLCKGNWPAIKNNPAGPQKLNQFFASAISPEVQVRIGKDLGFSPANPKALAMLPSDDFKLDAMAPENRAQQYYRDEQYYASHYDEIVDAVLNTIG